LLALFSKTTIKRLLAFIVQKACGSRQALNCDFAVLLVLSEQVEYVGWSKKHALDRQKMHLNFGWKAWKKRMLRRQMMDVSEMDLKEICFYDVDCINWALKSHQ
jgi:hypothetical protein